MAAQQQECQAVIVGHADVLVVWRLQRRDSFLAPAPRRFVAPLLDASTRRDPDQPGSWVARNAVGRPLDRRGLQRLLDRILATIEIAVTACQCTEDLRRQVPQQSLESGRRRIHISKPLRSITGRTSRTLSRSRI